MGNSQSQGPRGLHAPHLHPGPYGHPGVRPGIPGMAGGPPVRWPRAEPPIQVLPQLPPPMALRNTPNGTILQQGGTISSRPQAGPVPGRRPRSSSAHRPPQDETPDLARCGSEPDLRAQLNQQRRDPRDPRHHQMTRGRKKYRAPPAPHPGSEMESSSPDLNGWDGAPRKARLFKTRAETSRRQPEEEMHRRLAQTLSLPRPDLREDNRLWDDGRPWQSRPDLREEARSRQGRPASREENRTRQGRPDSREETRRQGRPESREEARRVGRPESREEVRLRQDRPESREDMKRQGRRSAGDGAGESRSDERDQGVWPGRREEPVSLPRVDAREGRRSAVEDPSALHRSRSQDALSAKSLSSPEFQAELVEAAQKIRPRSALIPRHINTRASPSPELPIQQVLKPKQGQEQTKENAQPSKTFYFGMEESNKTVVKAVNSNVNMTNREHRLTAVERSKNIMNKRHRNREPDDELALENFAANFQKNRQQHSVSGTSSLGSDPDPEEVDGGIALQLRPTLPKKQLEIPRFSPTAAWRLLSSMDAASPAASPDSGRGVLEERIPAPDCAQLSLDKSADSGISGDASPGGGHESSSELIDSPPKTIHYNHQGQKSLLLAWTPEQDLEESSSEEEPQLHSKMAAVPGAKLTTRGQLFSTLPRERIDEGLPDSGSHFNSLRRPTLVPSHPSDSNWLLSRSVPGSLNNGHATLLRTTSSPSSPDQLTEDPPVMTKFPSYSYLAQGGHVVYLPEYRSRCSPDYTDGRSPSPHYRTDLGGGQPYLPDLGMGHAALSRSCEDICADMQETDEPWTNRPSNRCMTEQRPHKKKKFTFQSTVRLIENRRLADKLSREAEFKEHQRLNELDAMRRVEEEFQRKRAREKANIRHQLRLFSLEEKEHASLPPMDWGRPEPDGAPASLPPVPRTGATTQVLSEFREATRDYRDYPHPRQSPDLHLEVPPRKNIVKHPRVVAEIPKNLHIYVSAQPSSSVTPSPRPRDNYRKEFAHGSTGRPTSSDSDSQPRTRPGSRQAGTRTRSSPTAERDSRSRSASPVLTTADRPAKLAPSARGLSASPTSRSPSPQRESSASRESSSRSPTPQREPAESPIPALVQPWSARRSTSPPLMVHSLSLVRSANRSRSVSRSPVAEGGWESAAVSAPGRRSRSSSPPRDGRGLTSPMTPRSRSVSPLAEPLIQVTPSVAASPRVLLSAVQPFNKAGKSYRPINFSPNKVAQIVT